MKLTILGADRDVTYPLVDPVQAVTIALDFTLRSNLIEAEEFYGLLEPRSASKLRDLINRARVSGSSGSFRNLVDDAGYLGVVDVEEKGVIVLVSAASGDPVPILNTAANARGSGWVFNLLQPSKPWISSPDLLSSRKIWARYLQLYRVLGREGISVSVSVDDLFLDLSTTSYLNIRSR
jgi:hypothetical protein